MKRKVIYVVGFIASMVAAFVIGVAQAPTIAPGPYYAVPSWDQKLPVSSRFIVLANWNNEAVLDRETGLVWERSPLIQTHAWIYAMSSCINRTTGGRMGWRLPAANELLSLVDPSVPYPNLKLPVGHPFTNVQGTPGVVDDYYWTSSENALAPEFSINYAMTVGFYDGGWGVAPMWPDARPVWCVRGPARVTRY
jgi:hypothetical protein